MLDEIGLTDHCFKELIKTRRDYLLLLVNGICNLNLKEEDIIFGDTEERDGTTFKTVRYDIKFVSDEINFNIEAQKKITDKKKNINGEYIIDINRAIYYLSLLHSRSYQFREKGYMDKKSIVIFIYLYDIPGDDVIQKTNLHNNSTNVEYDNLILYSVSLAKISKDSKIELERALKLLSEKDLTSYKDDKSKVIKEAANMLEGYSKSELAQIKRDEERKRQFEENMKLYVAERNGIEKGEAKGRAEGIAEGKVEGKAEATAESIRTMYKNGFDIETISKALSLDINYVKEVLSK